MLASLLPAAGRRQLHLEETASISLVADQTFDMVSASFNFLISIVRSIAVFEPISVCKIFYLIVLSVSFSALLRCLTTVWYCFDCIWNCSAGVISFFVS